MASAVNRDRAHGGAGSSISARLAQPSETTSTAPASRPEIVTESLSSRPLFGEQPSETPNNDVDDDAYHDAAEAAVSPSSVTSPPYWLNSNSGHQRSTSNMSVESILPAGAITLRDNETGDDCDRNNACWAKSVEITDYTTVNGSATNIGAFVVWNIRVETLNVGCPVGCEWRVHLNSSAADLPLLGELHEYSKAIFRV